MLAKRAAQGDADAMVSLASLLEIGIDCELDLEGAMTWWEKAAKLGHPVALLKLGREHNKSEALSEPSSSNKEQNQAPVSEVETTHHNPPKPAQEVRITKEILPKLLLVEDEAELSLILQEEFSRAGFEVISVTNGQQALQSLTSNFGFKVVVTDLQMPKMNGMQFIKTYRRMQLAEDAKLIVITSYSKPELIANGRKLGVNQWVTKPFDLKYLTDLVTDEANMGKKIA